MSRQDEFEENKRKYNGYHGTTITGKEFEVQEYIAADNIRVNLVGSSFSYKTNVRSIENNKVKDPFAKSCIAFESLTGEFAIGSYFYTNQGCIVRVIGYVDTQEIYVKFQDEFGYECKVYAQNLRKGEVRNPYLRNNFGGYLGVGPYNGDEYKYIYRIWYNILIRTYEDSIYYMKYHNRRAYENVAICQEWLCYNTFADWYIKTLGTLNPGVNYDVEKDMLSKLNMANNNLKIYSPETCCLIPHDLNTAFIIRSYKKSFTREADFIAFKRERDKKIHDLATHYYRLNALDKNIYNILMNWETKYSDLLD